MMATLKAFQAARLRIYRKWDRSQPPHRARLRSALLSLNASVENARDARRQDIHKHGALAVTTPWTVGEWQEGEQYEYEPRIPVYDNAGEEIFNIEAAESVADVASVRAIALANDIVKAVNMHDRLVAHLTAQASACLAMRAESSCRECTLGVAGLCAQSALLKEARATNLPGLTAEESALVREHKAEIAQGDK